MSVRVRYRSDKLTFPLGLLGMTAIVGAYIAFAMWAHDQAHPTPSPSPTVVVDVQLPTI